MKWVSEKILVVLDIEISLCSLTGIDTIVPLFPLWCSFMANHQKSQQATDHHKNGAQFLIIRCIQSLQLHFENAFLWNALIGKC